MIILFFCFTLFLIYSNTQLKKSKQPKRFLYKKYIMKILQYIFFLTNIQNQCKKVYNSPSPSMTAIHSSIGSPVSKATTNLSYSSLYSSKISHAVSADQRI